MNIMNFVKLLVDCGSKNGKRYVFSVKRCAKGNLMFIFLHYVHKPAMSTNTRSIRHKFMNIMKMYEVMVFNGFFGKRFSMDERREAKFNEGQKTFFIMFIKFAEVH